VYKAVALEQGINWSDKITVAWMQESVSSMESFGALKQRYKNASHSGMNERY